MKPIIEIKNIGKKFDIQHERGRYITFRDVISNVFKNPFDFAKTKLKNIVGQTSQEEFWALKNINLEIEAGEIVGVIGSNGAGKSTLLKILTGITPPSEGEIIMRGRVSSLLEVGTGFHPELTGRENIFLNGAILGMSHKEMQKKFDSIVEFAGVEKFLDTPVKHFSSGMYVRLAFSVAAHLEPDILLVDEVLAVGDAEFQKKCLGKMEEVTKKEGRTILLVSHNISAIQSLCKKTLLLESGKVKMFDSTNKVIDYYIQHGLNKEVLIKNRKDRSGDGRLRVDNFKLVDKDGKDTNAFISGENCQLWIEYTINDTKLKNINISIGIDSLPNYNRIALISNQVSGETIPVNTENGYIKINFPKLPLNVGQYQFTIFADENGKTLDWIKGAGNFIVNPGNFYSSNNLPKQGNFLMEYNFNE